MAAEEGSRGEDVREVRRSCSSEAEDERLRSIDLGTGGDDVEVEGEEDLFPCGGATNTGDVLGVTQTQQEDTPSTFVGGGIEAGVPERLPEEVALPPNRLLRRLGTDGTAAPGGERSEASPGDAAGGGLTLAGIAAMMERVMDKKLAPVVEGLGKDLKRVELKMEVVSGKVDVMENAMESQKVCMSGFDARLSELEKRHHSGSSSAGSSSYELFVPSKVLVLGFPVSGSAERLTAVADLLRKSDDSRIVDLHAHLISPKEEGQLVLIECGELMVEPVLKWWRTLPASVRAASGRRISMWPEQSKRQRTLSMASNNARKVFLRLLKEEGRKAYVEVDCVEGSNSAWIMVAKKEQLRISLPIDRDLKLELEWMGSAAQWSPQLRTKLEEEVIFAAQAGGG